jgi:hypothetical protein
MTDSLLAWCRDNQMYLILDLHAAPGGQGHDLNISDGDPAKPSLWDSPGNRQKTIALWKELAGRYKNESWIGGYDILNEPNWGFTDSTDKNGLRESVNAPLKELMVEITKAIRSVDQNHLIIIEGNGWGNNYNGLLPPWDNNMALSFHKYWNFNTTEAIQAFLNYREKYNVPVWLGESGENSNVWFTQAISLMETNNIGWCWWPLKKMGINNPLEIQSNPEYDKILAYWAGKGPRPDTASAWKGLMELAEHTNFGKNKVHNDVVDAMLRQVKSNETRAFVVNRIHPGSVLPAVHYDLGRNGIAYFDVDSADYHISNGSNGGNRFRTFRNDGVDIKQEGNDLVISQLENNEWLQYTIDVKTAGKYNIACLVSTETAGELLVMLPGKSVSETISVPGNGGEGNWQYVKTGTIQMGKGVQVLKLVFSKGGYSLKEIRFEKAGK